MRWYCSAGGKCMQIEQAHESRMICTIPGPLLRASITLASPEASHMVSSPPLCRPVISLSCVSLVFNAKAGTNSSRGCARHPSHATKFCKFSAGASGPAPTHVAPPHGICCPSRAARFFSSSRALPPSQYSQLPWGGAGTPMARDRRCATLHKKSTGASGSSCSSSPFAGHIPHIGWISHETHLVMRVSFFLRTCERKFSQPSLKLPARKS